MLENKQYDFSTPIVSDITLIANFKKVTPETANYTLKHFKQNIEDDDYTLSYTTELSGKIGEKTPNDNTEYTGFSIKEQKSSIIKADNSSVHEVYYDRNIITYTFNTDGGSSIEPISGKYGAKVPEIPTPEKAGYIFTSWNPTIPQTFEESLFFTAEWVLDTNIPYTIFFRFRLCSRCT